MTLGKIEIGTKLWYVPNNAVARGQPHEITIKAMGRKWATTDRHLRIDITSGQADGGKLSSPGRAYTSETSYADEVRRCQAWDVLRLKIEYRGPPDGVTLNDIELAARLLGLDP